MAAKETRLEDTDELVQEITEHFRHVMQPRRMPGDSINVELDWLEKAFLRINLCQVQSGKAGTPLRAMMTSKEPLHVAFQYVVQRQAFFREEVTLRQGLSDKPSTCGVHRLPKGSPARMTEVPNG